jgi:predicted TIM-barrel fold metal-dependent hydrolase
MDLKIFDAHMHVGHWGSHVINGRAVSPFEKRKLDSADKVLAYMERSNIARAVIVPMYSPDQQQAYQINRLVLEIAKRAPDKFIPGLWVDPSPAVQELLDATLEIAQEHDVRVLKASAQTWEAQYSPDPASWDESFGDAMTKILAYVRNTESVIQIHTGSKKSRVHLIEKLIQYAGPEVRFHLVHMGNTASGHFYLIPRLKEWLGEGLDVVCDTAWARGFAVRWLFDLAAESPLLSKSILFASDEPWGIFQSELAKVLDAAEDHAELLKAVLWANATRVYCCGENLT